MIFRAKTDAFFIKFFSVIVMILALIMFLPVIDGYVQSRSYLIVNIIFFIVVVSYIVWGLISIRYIFHEDHLLVKGGLFRSRIPYDAITRIHKTKNWWFGYRMAFAKNGLLEIHYTTGLWGSVIIAPVDKTRFIEELKKRCPNDLNT